MCPEVDPTIKSINSFLRLSKEIGNEPAMHLYESETRRKQREFRWQYKARNALHLTQEKLGLGGFSSRRMRRILRMVEADANKIIDPIVAPVLDPLITVMLQES